MPDDERAIRLLVETWLTATERGDVDAVLDLMADDVVFTVAGRAPFGKSEFAVGARAMVGIAVRTESDIQEISISGDWACLRNRLRVTMTPPGKRPIVRAGYTLTLLRKDADGAWRIARDANLLTAEEAHAAEA